MADKEEGKPVKMSGSKCTICSSLVHDAVRCERKKSSTNMESLPDELLFDILLHLPADDIYNGARLVCKKWHSIINTRNFVYSHLHHSTPGLIIIQNASHYTDPVFMTMRHGRIEISNPFSYKFKDLVCAPCNGLVLDYDSENPYSLRIVNPLTKQQLITPPFYEQIKLWHHRFSGIAYAAASMQYKVVQPYYRFALGNPYARGCAILTVGVDNSWRLVSKSRVHPIAILVALRKPPLITEGFMHWLLRDTCVLTLNVETEIITRTLVPRVGKHRSKWLLSTGRSLSMVIACGGFSFHVWDMKSETGEWTKMYYKVELEAHKHIFEPLSESDRLVPVGWLKYGEVLVLHRSSRARVCIAYNVLTQEIDSFELDDECNQHIFKVHTNSLV